MISKEREMKRSWIKYISAPMTAKHQPILTMLTLSKDNQSINDLQSTPNAAF